jgi:hypothetical protein
VGFSCSSFASTDPSGRCTGTSGVAPSPRLTTGFTGSIAAYRHIDQVPVSIDAGSNGGRSVNSHGPPQPAQHHASGSVIS